VGARRRRKDRRRPRHLSRAAAAAAVAHPVVAEGEGETGRETEESARGLKGERMSDAAAAVAQQDCSAQAECTRTGLLPGHYLLRISFPNLFIFSLSFYFLIPFGFIFILSIWDTSNVQ